ncbi:histone-lysine N-methyltransferase, H3 lysine-79 specific [Anopheles darlingi]|uniref:histone-lysine N-methyltransferase, H3 lysine-79 specific n=1 Tax=Anopheles darlingi TaxID=43151 RepID=UPI00210008CF|nr:histone-lysine N-methyltransferase, H3 lysine-79 specific [Anopheles darlingi]
MFDDGSGGGGGGRDSADEDDFFKPSSTGSGGKSSLAKIFGLTSSKAASVPDRKNPVSVEAPKSIKVSDRYGPSNFRYIPSTEPDTEEKEQSATEEKSKPAAEWVIVRASIVSAYKLVDNENKFLGKVGLVLLKSSTAHRLLLYRTKSDVLCAATLNRETKLLLKQDYLQFRADETNEFWSILFESESDRAVMLPLIENCCTIEREPLVEEPASEPEKEPEEEPAKQINNNNNNSNNTGNSNSRKIQLVARMARMGQAIPLPPEKQRLSTDAPPIPSSPPALAGGSDSSDDTSDSKIETIPSRSIPIAARRPNVTHTLNMQMVPLAGMMTTTGTGGHSANSTDVNLNLIMSETRMQNTEVRMNLTKLESKLDRVLDRIDLLSVHGDRGASSALDKDAELLQLEEKVLDLKRDNHSLRAKLQSEQQVAEERRSQHAQLMEKIRSLTEAEETLREEIGALKAKIEANSTDREIANERQHELETKLSNARQNEERKTKELEQTLRELEEQRKKENQLQQELVEQRNRTLEVTAKMELLQQEMESGKSKPESEQASVGSLVKDIMNNCYQQLCDQIADPHILRLIASTIKRETKAALDREAK